MKNTIPLSHKPQGASLKSRIAALKKRSSERGDLPDISVAKQHEWIDELATFELGKFLMTHQGLNGYWTDYILLHPEQPKSGLSELEDFILNRSPVVLATQERFRIFKKETQKLLREGIRMASIPSGLMSDLLTLDYSGIQSYSLTGIDIDPESLELGKKRCPECDWIQADAWDLQMTNAFDLITSNGLNIYEPDSDRVTELYKSFHQALSPEGILVISFLTPPSEWNTKNIVLKDAEMQRQLFIHVLEPGFQIFRGKQETKEQLVEAGFRNLEWISDSQGIFPTVIAKKCAN